MRILMVTDDLLIGGAARHVVDLSNGLVNAGHPVTVAATDGPLRLALKPEVGFLPLHLKDNRTFRSRPAGIPLATLSLTRELRIRHFDIIHSHKRFSHLPSKAASWINRTPHVTSYHSLVTERPSSSFFGDATICVSRYIETDLRAQYPGLRSRLFTVHNGVHPQPMFTDDERRDIRNRLDAAGARTIISSIGHYTADKDRSTFLQALSILKDQQVLPGTVILLQGFGPLEQEIRQIAAQRGLDESIRFIGPSTPSSYIIAVSDFMVLNSVREGFGLVLIEAASVGVPHVATAVGGIPEFVSEGVTGLLVPPQDPPALAKAIRRFIEDPALRSACGRAAMALYQERFGFDAMIEGTLGVYRSVTGGAS